MSSYFSEGGGGYLGAPTTGADSSDSERSGAGWVGFAGVMIIIAGFMNVIYGIAAIGDASFYADDARFIFGDLNTWGWVHVVIGSIQVCSGFLIFTGSEFGRWIGVLTAGLNMMTQLVFISSFPLLALAIFAIDILVVYGLIAHGGRRFAL